ncbi:MAG: hypothetical protein ACK559_18695, partial [bacterium]
VLLLHGRVVRRLVGAGVADRILDGVLRGAGGEGEERDDHGEAPGPPQLSTGDARSSPAGYARPMSAMIEVRDLSKQYGGFAALSGVSFQVAAGEIVGFLGPNGA